MLTYEEEQKIRRANRKRTVAHQAFVQTYRIDVTFECGHKQSFTSSGRKWQDERAKILGRRRECYRCAGAAIAEATKAAGGKTWRSGG